MNEKIERMYRVIDFLEKRRKDKAINDMDANERYTFDLLDESIELVRHSNSCLERINEIYRTANGECRRLTDAERQAIANLNAEVEETEAIDKEVIGEFFELVEEMWGVS